MHAFIVLASKNQGRGGYRVQVPQERLRDEGTVIDALGPDISAEHEPAGTAHIAGQMMHGPVDSARAAHGGGETAGLGDQPVGHVTTGAPT